MPAHLDGVARALARGQVVGGGHHRHRVEREGVLVPAGQLLGCVGGEDDADLRALHVHDVGEVVGVEHEVDVGLHRLAQGHSGTSAVSAGGSSSSS